MFCAETARVVSGLKSFFLLAGLFSRADPCSQSIWRNAVAATTPRPHARVPLAQGVAHGEAEETLEGTHDPSGCR
jgi:hypothetical protein